MRNFFRSLLPMVCLAFSIPGVISAGISVEGGLTREKTAGRGETYQGVITIKNQGDTPQELKIYQSDYRFTCEGVTSYGNPGEDPRSNAGWIAFSPGRFSVPPQERATLNYTVIVPDDEALLGTYWSMLMIECIPESSPEASGAQKERNFSLGITQVMRYAVQMITHLGETGEKKIRFLQTKILKDGSSRILQVDMENIGERLLRPRLWCELYHEDGTSPGRFQGEQYRIFPNTSKRFTIDISSVSTGSYQALVVADCGENDLFGAMYTLKFDQ